MKITIDIEATEVKQILDAIIKSDAELKIITPPTVPASFTTAKKLIDSARTLDKAIEEAKPEPAPRKTTSDGKLPTSLSAKPKMEMPLPPKSTIKESLTVEPKPGKAPACVKTWSQEELNLLRTCPSDDAARFVYASHFKDARSEGAIRQKWYKMNLAGEILRPGDNVRIDGETKQGVIQSFTDNRQCANLGYFGDPAIYQTPIDKLQKVERE